jgi:hypothetical protein
VNPIRRRVLSKQQEDIKRLLDLAAACYQDVAAAAILIFRKEEIHTRDDAVRFAVNNPDVLRRHLNQLYQLSALEIEWMHDDFLTVVTILSELDFARIARLQEGGHSTKRLYEDKIIAAQTALTKKTSGVLACLTSIFESHAADNFPILVLDIFTDVKARARAMLRLYWAVRNPVLYIVLGRNIIIIFLILFVVSIPVWYMFGGSQPPTHVINSILERPVEDTKMLRLVLVAPDRSFPEKIFSVASFVGNALFSVPILFLLLAAIIEALRRRFRAGGAFAPLRKYEIMFRAIASDLQRSLPQGMRGPLFMVEFVMTGDTTTFTNLGPIANLNFQGIQVADSINAHVGELLQNKETENIGNAIRQLTKAIGGESRLADSERKELLEQIELLGSQAAMPIEQRKRGVIRPIIDSISGVCAGIGGLAAAWATWGIVISKFFGF